MELIDKITGTITVQGQKAVDKAKDLAEIAKLKGQIASCQDVVKKNYAEIGKLVYEEFEKSSALPDDTTEEGEWVEDAATGSEKTIERYARQCKAIANAKRAIAELEKKISEIKEG